MPLPTLVSFGTTLPRKTFIASSHLVVGPAAPAQRGPVGARLDCAWTGRLDGGTDVDWWKAIAQATAGGRRPSQARLPKTVTGDGSYTSPPFTPAAGGSYW